jgi:hypothetical protein
MKRVGFAVVALAGLLLMSSVASAQLCVVGILAKAIYVGANEHRELTTKEAMSCGLLNDDPAKPDKRAKKNKAKKNKAKKKIGTRAAKKM